jgi:glyoxylase-like metal-dependent hydrolase (beta-lactamase superfamily II)
MTKPRHALIATAAFLIAKQTVAHAQDRDASILSYRTVQVADGIYAFIRPEERSGFQAGNSIAIVGDDGVLVFDTGNIPSSTRRQIAEIRKLTDKPVRYVVNSHWHPDHNLGNSEYRAAFPAATIIGTTATRNGIVERVPGYFNQMKSFTPVDSMMRVRLATGKLPNGSELPASTRAFYAVVTRDYGEFMPEVLTARPMAPDLVFDDSLTITLGKRQVKVVRPGRGNTEGDAYLYVPDANVLLTGDLLTLPCPFPGTAYFSDWISALDQLEARHATIIVPGHGDVQHDYSFLDLTRELLVFTRDKARGPALKGQSLEQFRKDADFSAFIERFTGGDTLRKAAFENFYVQPALQRAYDEAKFLTQAPITPVN